VERVGPTVSGKDILQDLAAKNTFEGIVDDVGKAIVQLKQ